MPGEGENRPLGDGCWQEPRGMSTDGTAQTLFCLFGPNLASRRGCCQQRVLQPLGLTVACLAQTSSWRCNTKANGFIYYYYFLTYWIHKGSHQHQINVTKSSFFFFKELWCCRLVRRLSKLRCLLPDLKPWVQSPGPTREPTPSMSSDLHPRTLRPALCYLTIKNAITAS